MNESKPLSIRNAYHPVCLLLVLICSQVGKTPVMLCQQPLLSMAWPVSQCLDKPMSHLN